MTFKEKVQSMTGKQILKAMIDGLEKPWVEVNMCTFGNTRKVSSWKTLFIPREKCFGCAATNAICQISGKVFPLDKIYTSNARAGFLHIDQGFLDTFESAIDDLRCGKVQSYNFCVEQIDVGLLPSPVSPLPLLDTETWKDNIQEYKDYHNSIPD